MNFPSIANRFLNEHVDLLNYSYKQFLGQDLVLYYQSYESLAQTLFHAPFAVLSHNTAPDPIFNYANLRALELFGFNWDEFIQMPSRLSAEPLHQASREQLLAEVAQKGYSRNYQGIRITKTGQRFLIKDAVVWNLLDSAGEYKGQAAKFENWEFL